MIAFVEQNFEYSVAEWREMFAPEPTMVHGDEEGEQAACADGQPSGADSRMNMRVIRDIRRRRRKEAADDEERLSA